MTERHDNSPTEPNIQKPGSTDADGLAHWALNTTPQDAAGEFERVTGRKVTELPQLWPFKGEPTVAAAPPFAQGVSGEQDVLTRPRRRERWSLPAAAATAAWMTEGLKRIDGADVLIGVSACSFYSDGTIALIAGLPGSMNGRFLVCYGRKFALEWLPDREMHRVIGLTFNVLDQAIDALEAGDRSALKVE